jgi:hypothetical protein
VSVSSMRQRCDGAIASDMAASVDDLVGLALQFTVDRCAVGAVARHTRVVGGECKRANAPCSRGDDAMRTSLEPMGEHRVDPCIQTRTLRSLCRPCSAGRGYGPLPRLLRRPSGRA